MAVGSMSRVARVAIAASFSWLVVAGSANGAYEGVPTPEVSGPLLVSKSSYPFLATDIDLRKYGYVEKEFTYTGQAYRYSWSASSPAEETATRVENGGYPFKTRMIVRRPIKAKDFNGVVVAEWMNVTALHDLEANWFGDPYYLLKNGYTFVGISAQHQGVSVLCCNSTPALGVTPFNPARYAGLNVNGEGTVGGDALSYDIYAAALKAVRGHGEGSDPLGPLPAPQRVIASGESQSCTRLGNHYNRIEPLHGIVDAYLLTVCDHPVLRSDRNEKAIRILSENETADGPLADPDTDSFRKWEVAGASHLPRLAFDNWNRVVSRDRAPQKVNCKSYPLSLVQWPFSQNRAISDLVKWSKGGADPATAAPMDYEGGELVRDGLGHAEGGIRYPEVEVPTGVNSGENVAVGDDLLSNFCGLLGSHEAFGADQVGQLHGALPNFVRKSAKVTDRLVEDGFLLRQDAVRLKAIARRYPLLDPGAPKARPVRRQGKAAVRLSWFGTTLPRTRFTVARARAGAGKPNWKVVRKGIRAQRAVLVREPRGRWIYAVRSATRVEERDPKTNRASFPLRRTGYSAASKPVRVGR